MALLLYLNPHGIHLYGIQARFSMEYAVALLKAFEAIVASRRSDFDTTHEASENSSTRHLRCYIRGPRTRAHPKGYVDAVRCDFSG